MTLEIPKPYPDPAVHETMFVNGLKRFPERKTNYERFKKAKREAIIDYMPVMMDIEPSSRCNFRCIMCQVSDWPKGKRADDMTFSDFKQLLDVLWGLVEIKIQGLGEPLLNHDIFKMISFAQERDIWTRLTVNGSLLHVNENYKRLIDSNPGEVQVSIDAANKDIFEKIRKGANFDQIVQNTTELNNYEQKQNLLKTRCWSVVQKLNTGQLKDIVKLGAKMKFRRMTFSLAVSYYGNDIWTQKNKSIEVKDELSEEIFEELIEEGNKYGIEVTFWDSEAKYELDGDDLQKRCSWLWERSFISSDLRIVPCCVFSNPDMMDLGSAINYSDNWNNVLFQNLRKAHIKGNIPAFCKQCYGIT